MTLYLTDETTVHDMLGAAWLPIIALRIDVAKLDKETTLKTAKEQGVTRASYPGPLEKEEPQKGHPLSKAWSAP